MAGDELFEVKDESKLTDIIPLVSEPYTYENMVNNPIIKPIAECDRSLRDLDEMVYKKLIDARRLKEKINAVINDVPAYQDSNFIADLIKLAQSSDDSIKLQDIEIANLKECIKRMADEVRTRYGVRFSDAEEYTEPVTVIPEGDINSYLEKLINSQDENISNIAKQIKEIFPNAKGREEKEKFTNAGLELYGKETDKTRKQILAKMIRMEI